MNKQTLINVFSNLKSGVSKHSPEILTGIGIAGMITTTILAVKATPKAMELIDDAEDQKEETLTPLETVKCAWKPYVPAAITGVMSVTCLIGANSVNAKRNAALATAYSLSSRALSEYKDAVVETLDDKKAAIIKDKVKDSMSEKKVKSEPANNIIVTGAGETLCLDMISGQYFKSDIESIKSARNEINAQMISFDYVSLNEFYDLLGIRRTSIGDELGWNIGRDGTIQIDFSTQLADVDGVTKPCIVISYSVEPRYDYSKYF